MRQGDGGEGWREGGRQRDTGIHRDSYYTTANLKTQSTATVWHSLRKKTFYCWSWYPMPVLFILYNTKRRGMARWCYKYLYNSK